MSRKRTPPWELAVGPPPERWDDWVELDPAAWPEKHERRFRCIPTICFNCESACGLLAFVDKATGETVKFEGNPVHPGSRGRTCAKGPATLNQIRDPERILQADQAQRSAGLGPVSREVDLGRGARRRRRADPRRPRRGASRRGSSTTSDGRGTTTSSCACWVPGASTATTRTPTCAAPSARTGYALWSGADRPSPDYSTTKFMLLLSAHLETGHYFNPHAQRIIDAKSGGARTGGRRHPPQQHRDPRRPVDLDPGRAASRRCCSASPASCWRPGGSTRLRPYAGPTGGPSSRTMRSRRAGRASSASSSC